ncbi:uncharacterized protein LTR77_007035 [Saxophila tyrrhenica]|uniref:NAD(P)-binding protein n=1 Tax=Saxophila tyrrhenica TaxID=1690608 RepID=A0AAV9P3K3_9PEZI|nr:hypothetical protein LTR77_007035 [Saxophila tyrrhenica]
MASGKYALITGVASGGMGEGHMKALLSRGISVIATSIDLKLLEYLDATSHGDDAEVFKLELDVTSKESIAATVERVKEITGGKLDFLLNNAGYGYYMPLLDVDLEKARKQYEVNVWGVLALTQAFFPLLRVAKGTIINQSSMAGVQGFNRPYMGIYSSSKAAVYSLSDYMRVELAPFDIKVLTLVTGAVKTEFYTNIKEGGKPITLPPDSPYNPIRKHIETMMNGSLAGMKGHDRLQVTRSTIATALRYSWLSTRYVRRGFGALKIWLMQLLLPVWLVDRWARQAGSLDKLKQMLASG